MKVKPHNATVIRLVEDLRAEAKRLHDEKIDDYHAALMEQAANIIERTILIHK